MPRKNKNAAPPKKKIPKADGKNSGIVTKTRKAKFKKSRITEAEKATQFKPGNKLGGRPKGCRNRFAEKFIEDFYHDWENHGASAVARVREEEPAAYLRIGSSLIPRELTINSGEATLDRMLEKLDDAQLDALIAGLVALGEQGDAQSSDAAENTPRLGTESDFVH